MTNKKNRFRLKTEIIYSETKEIEAYLCIFIEKLEDQVFQQDLMKL